MPRINHFPKTVGVRLDESDGDKLKRLCAYTNRRPSELLRYLLRAAQPNGVPQITFMRPDSPPYDR